MTEMFQVDKSAGLEWLESKWLRGHVFFFQAEDGIRASPE